jgi:hypothetical protein
LNHCLTLVSKSEVCFLLLRDEILASYKQISPIEAFIVTYFHYKRKQRRIALTLLLNALLALCMHFAAAHYLPKFDQAAAAELLLIADIAIWFIIAILIGIAIYFWFEDKSIELRVSANSLHYYDPTFMDYGWTVPVADILAIEQYTDVQQHFMNTYIVLKSGERKQLMYSNLSIDRWAFYAALNKANPNITLPANPYQYEMRKPKWAQKWLNRNK